MNRKPSCTDVANRSTKPRGFSYGYSSREVAYHNSIGIRDDVYSAGVIIGSLVSFDLLVACSKKLTTEQICRYQVSSFKAHAEISQKIFQGEMPFGDEKLGSLVLQMLVPRGGNVHAKLAISLTNRGFRASICSTTFGACSLWLLGFTIQQ
jgi:hypothetical protein